MIVPIALGCDQIPDSVGYVSYSPPFAAATLSWNSAGEITIEAGKRFVTPIGVFEFGAAKHLDTEPSQTLVVIQDRRTGQEIVYSVSSDEEFVVESTAEVRIQGRKIFLDITDDACNTLQLRPKQSPRVATVPSTTHASMTGQWETEYGDVLVLDDQGQAVTCRVTHSEEIFCGNSRLHRDHDTLSGTLQLAFYNDPYGRTYESEIRLSATSPYRLEGTMNRILCDPYSQELYSEPIPIAWTRNN